MPATNPLWSELDSLLMRRQAEGLERYRKSWVPHSPRLIVSDDGCPLVHFGSNDYLCLGWNGAQSSSEMHGCQEWFNGRYGAGASPSISGYTPDHATLVSDLAMLSGAEDAILFPSGYSANVGTIAALAGESDVIFSDRLNHASLIDGCRLSKARIIVYPHGDLFSLEKLIRSHRNEGKRGFIVTDSVFSMDGDLADLRRVMELCEQFDLTAIVDEAHATGIYGPQGGGLVLHLGIESERLVKIGTLSKSIGAIGGFVAGPKVLIRWLVNFARSYIYSTSLPIPVVRFASRSILLMRQMELERVRLRQTAVHLRTKLRELGHRVGSGDSPIVSIYAPAVETVVGWSARLRERGFYVPAIRPPTVPIDSCLLRVSLNLSHTDEDLRMLAEACRF
jgi:8-amino-7-oxononanoate synthase